MAKFERRRRTVDNRMNTDDSKGIVRVTVFRANGGAHVKGNITRSVSLDNVKVSEVFSAIEDALLEGDES